MKGVNNLRYQEISYTREECEGQLEEHPKVDQALQCSTCGAVYAKHQTI